MKKTKTLIVLESGKQVMMLDDIIMNIIENAGGEVTGVQTCYNSYCHIHTQNQHIVIAKKDCAFNDSYDEIANLSSRTKLGAKLNV